MANVNGNGKYFEIKCKSNTNLRLNVAEGSIKPGAPVNVWPDHSGENQVWYEDPLTGTVRSRRTNLCLDVDNNGDLCMQPYQKSNHDQKWRYNRSKGVLENIMNPQKIIVAEGAGKVAGAKVIVQNYEGDAGQRWIIECKPPIYFRLLNENPDDGTFRILEVKGDKGKAGLKVIASRPTARITDSQLWFENHMGNLACKNNGKLTLDGSTDFQVTLREYNGELTKNFWAIIGNKIVNKDDHNEVLEASDVQMNRDGSNNINGLNNRDVPINNRDDILFISIYITCLSYNFLTRIYDND
ncbi:hypothetical protein HELRODRAFT_191872 [Helobdella robusta]|uniref:Ricin B lectin domain-containing protein n=1 Tax=Helobdella robusta TaxID=6412 RepID=T1FTD5_HELRO|nr:hypothetical protein HELRODRAFT_191872 [Helobdella robusta]ESO03561.1 hypothetical protein HELRODRAFT_191872 [Helobdella robusta]